MGGHLRGNAHVKDFTKHLFLFHWRDICKGGGVERRDIWGMANGWSGSRGATISLRRTFGVLGSVAWGRSSGTLWLAGLRTRLPSARVGLTGATVLRGAGRATVAGSVSVALRGLTIRTRRNHARYLLIGRITRTRWDHAWLTIVHHATSAGRREVTTGRIVHWTVHVATRDASGSSLLHTNLVALSDLALELLPANFTALGQRDVERFGTNHLVVHFCDGLSGLLGTRVANETEALGVIFIVTHNFGAGDGSEGLELRAKFFVVYVVVEVLDVEVNALIFAQLFHLGLLVGLPQLFLALGFLLRPGDEELPAIVLVVVEGIDRSCSIVVVLEVDKSKAFALSVGVGLKNGGGDRPKLSEYILEIFLRNLRVQVLDIDVGELFPLLVNLSHAFLVKDSCQQLGPRGGEGMRRPS